MRRLLPVLVLLCAPAQADLITRLPTQERVVALTFDACESRTPATFDTRILDFLAREDLPYTVFLSGRFARRNADAVRRLASEARVEFENHSLNHPQHLEALPPERQRVEVVEASALIRALTGRTPRFFRFPAGNYDAAALAAVEAAGLRVVHWGTPSGDPDPALSAARLVAGVLHHTRPGSIHIFHINGRGWHTADALPEIVSRLRADGYRFVRLDERL